MKGFFLISWVFWGWLWCLLPGVLQAQTGCFDADFLRGCAPLTVTLTDCSGSNEILYDFGDGVFRVENTFTYTTPGLKTIRQIIQTGSGGAQLVKQDYIAVFAPTPPEVTFSTCPGREVALQFPNPLYDGFRIDYGDGTVEEVNAGSAATHTFGALPAYDITVTGFFTDGGGTCGVTMIPFQPLNDLLPPAIPLLTMGADGQSATLTLSLPQDIPYQLQERIGNGTFQTIATVANTTTFALANKDFASAVHCYRLVAGGNCGQGDVFSDVLCSLLPQATAEGNENRLVWPSLAAALPPGFLRFEVRRDGALLAELPAAQNSYADRNLVCGQEYCYQVAIVWSAGRTEGPLQCVTAITGIEPEAPALPLASITAQGILLSWVLPPDILVQGVTVYRSVEGGAFEEIPAPPGQSFTDAVADPAGRAYCYQLAITDACGRISPRTPVFCPVRLQGEKAGFDNSLTWSAYTGFPGDFVYVLEIADSQGNVLAEAGPFPPSSTDFLDPFDPDLEADAKSYRIRVVATANPGLFAFSNTVLLEETASVKVPDAFTPNADGLNDTFFVRGVNIREATLTVHDRWGNVWYAGDALERGWDGTHQGKLAMEGPYLYIIRYLDRQGKAHVQKGMLQLIR